jgi:hypothetical protein
MEEDSDITSIIELISEDIRSDERISTMNILRNVFPKLLERTSNKTFNKGMIMAYCTSKNNKLNHKDSLLNCWLCDKLGTGRNIFNYNTIFNSRIKLHNHCFDKCKMQCIQKTLSISKNYKCITTPSNEIFIYNRSKIYMIYFSYHKLEDDNTFKGQYVNSRRILLT